MILRCLILGFLALDVAHAHCPYLAARNSPHETGQQLQTIDKDLKATSKKGVFFMNRIAPSSMKLYVANADGTNEQLLLGENSSYDYHASWSADDKWITFTSERNGDGQSDLYRVRANGSDVQQLVASPSIEDAGVLSPDGTKLAYVSSANGYKANIWVKDLKTGDARNLTNTRLTVGHPDSPDGHFAPSWSPDGQWIAFSSDRNTDWATHDNGTRWEHTQELSIYAIRPDGTDFRQVVSKPGYSLGSPRWSYDGKWIVFYEMTLQGTWDIHQPTVSGDLQNNIISVDFATGKNRRVEATVAGMGIYPSYVSNANKVGYLVKGGDWAGLNYTDFNVRHQWIGGDMRSPSWSSDGSKVVYERPAWDIRPDGKALYNWHPDWEYRHMDAFPLLNNATGRMVLSQKQLGNTSIVTQNPDTKDYQLVFNPFTIGEVSSYDISSGNAGAYQPSWTGDGEWITFGFGFWFQERTTSPGWIYRVRSNGSDLEQLTGDDINSGFPSFSPDGSHIVYRVFSERTRGLRIVDVNTREVFNLTNGWDNNPGWSPDGSRIVFTRRNGWDESNWETVVPDRYDVWTIRPDGSNPQRVTEALANDAHAVWTNDGRIAWSTGQWGFRAEAATYDNTFQPYATNMVMNADGTGKVVMTESLWEDSMPLFVPNEFLR